MPFRHTPSLLGLVAAATFAIAAAGCGDDANNDDGGGGAGGQPGTGGEGGGPPPTLPQLAEGWNEINPPDTICSRGTPYAFWAKPGKVNKVIIDFIGGGACWDEFTCSVADSIFEPDVESVRQAIMDDTPEGIYDHANPANPFADWYHVIVPYCTGDIHWGDAVTTYGTGEDAVTINHKGAVNARAVLDWVYQGFSKPEQVLVTGCSAGSYGAALWSGHVMNHYTDSEVFQFGDSGAGIITQDFFTNSFPSWNAEQAFPAFIPALDPSKVDILTMALPDLYAGIANHFPEQKMSQYNTFLDDNQTFYFVAMGGSGAEEWSQLMQASITDIESRAPNFAAYTAPGEQHCIIPYDNFYTVQSNGVLLVDWLRSMVEKASFDSVTCQGAECEQPTP
jgi:hypothetical protein